MCEVSVILPFSDDEDDIGVAVRRIAQYLRRRQNAFEILCIDEDSGDNSHAVLGLIRAEVPELRVAVCGGRGRGVAEGIALARGTVVWTLTPKDALSALSPFGAGYTRIVSDELDVFIVGDRFSVCRRTRILDLSTGLRGPQAAHSQLAKRALRRDLRVESHLGRRGVRPSGPLVRWLGAGPLRNALLWVAG